MQIKFTKKMIEVFDKYVGYVKNTPSLVYRLKYVKDNEEFPFKLRDLANEQNFPHDEERPISIAFDDDEIMHVITAIRYIINQTNWDLAAEASDDRKTMKPLIEKLNPIWRKIMMKRFNNIGNVIASEKNIEVLREMLLNVHDGLNKYYDPDKYGHGFGDDDGCYARSVISTLGHEW